MSRCPTRLHLQVDSLQLKEGPGKRGVLVSPWRWEWVRDLTTQEWSTSGMQVINQSQRFHQELWHEGLVRRMRIRGFEDSRMRMIPWSTMIYGDTPWFCIGGATVNVCERHWWTPSSHHISAGASCRDIAARCTPPNLWMILGKMRFQTMIIHWTIEDVLLKGQKKILK